MTAESFPPANERIQPWRQAWPHMKAATESNDTECKGNEDTKEGDVGEQMVIAAKWGASASKRRGHLYFVEKKTESSRT